MQNKNLKLGLCGLALTSFLAVNAHSVVHADTVQNNNANNNAITWDSDSDDSQVVKEEPQQQTAPQAVQKQATVQASQSQPVQNKKIMISDVSSTSVSQKRAEMSIVRQSNAQTSTVNRLNADNRQVKVANVNATDPIKITNPQNNQIVVHYTNTKGQAVAGLADKVIDATKSSNGNYVPNGYSLAHGNGQYSVKSSETISDFDILWNDNPNLYRGREQTYHSGEQIDMFLQWDNETQTNKPVDHGEFIKDSDIKRTAIDLARNALTNSGRGNLLTSKYPPNWFHIEYVPLNGHDRFYFSLSNDSNGTQLHSADPDTEANQLWHGRQYVWVAQSASETDDSPSIVDTNPDDFAMAEKLLNYWTDQRIREGLSVIHKNDLDSKVKDADAISSDNMVTPAWLLFTGNTNTKQFQDGNTVFTDGGSATSSVGNHIDVPVVQAVPVNDASQIRKSAERIISVNLPDDPAVKDRYKGILNDKNQIVQTINFTRSKTIDQLTGATLSETPWSGPSSFPAVTLPDIPGYTMTMS